MLRLSLPIIVNKVDNRDRLVSLISITITPKKDGNWDKFPSHIKD